MSNRIFYKNTLMLYLLRISNYLFSFITVPLQTRVLGPNNYALLGFALSFSVYFQNFIDFGFTLSATEKISKNKNNYNFINNMISKVFFCRLLLIIISFFAFIILVLTIDEFKKNYIIFFLYFLLSVILTFLPDYLYLGLEKMQYLTYKSIIARGIFTILLFVFLRKENQFYMVPIFNILGNVIALVFIYRHITKVLGYKLVKISFKELMDEFKWTLQFFLSRFANSIYSTINTMTIGFVFGSSAIDLGLYKTADQCIYTGKQLIIPITDSLFPHMANRKDFKLFKKLLILGSVIIIIGTIIVDIYAKEICVLLFGNKFIDSSLYLRLLSPTVFFAFLTMMFGFPVLSAIGKIEYANYSNIISVVFQIIVLAILFFTHNFSIINLCILTCISEFLIFIFRFFVYIIYKK